MLRAIPGSTRIARPALSRSGSVAIYMPLILTALAGFVSLGVDVGRMQMAKSELQVAADAAARQACYGLKVSVSTAQTKAVSAAGYNKVDGAALVLDPTNDIEFGTWNPATKAFVVLTGTARSSATAVRITARRTAARGTPISTVFARALGFPNISMTATAIAARGRIANVDIDATGAPWLAGMPNNSTIAATGGNTQPARAPANSPDLVSGMTLTAGAKLSFRQVAGQTSYLNAVDYGPDGNTNFIVSQDPVNGINTTYAPLNALVGIFLDARQPSTYSQAAALDFTTSTSRDFDTLSPQIKQVFFIGDGLNSSNELQQFTVPTGATRLYLGIMDEKGWWWDNTGTLQSTMLDDNITLVK